VNVDFSLTDHLIDLRRAVIAALQPGHTVGYGETLIITERFNTAVALAQEVEEENRILDHRIRASNDGLRNRKAAADITDVATGDNVTAFRLLSPKN
jgi:hypothetical protein